MPKGLHRYYGHGHLHFLTCSCYHRQPWLASPRRRDLFLKILEESRQRYRFVVVGYVVMPDHIHFADQRARAGHALDRDAGVEATLRAACAAEKEAESGAGRAVAAATEASLAAALL